MSLPESTEYWWGWSPQEKKQKSAEEIAAKKVRYAHNKSIRIAYKKKHLEMTRLQIIKHAEADDMMAMSKTSQELVAELLRWRIEMV